MKIVADANIPFVEKCFSSIGKVEVFPGRQITPKVVADADILLVRSVTRVDSDLLAESKVRFVATATIGFDHIDVDFLKKHNIGFASAPGSNANSVAEYVIAGLLEIAHKLHVNVEDKSIGIIGVGNVGSRVAKKASAIGMKLFLNDPPLQRQTKDRKYRPIEELYDCDFITIHTPLTFEGKDKTFHLADERFFKLLKKGCVFLNTSRGRVVETAALKDAIKSARLSAVMLDVWENEPNIDAELLEMVDIGTPHIAGYSFDGKVGGMIMIYKAACEYFDLRPEFDIESFLPKPDVTELQFSPIDDSQQELLRKAAKKVYDIEGDDLRMRKMLGEPMEERGDFFTRLRKDYPVRREFQNTKVILNSPCAELGAKLAGIGFKVSDSEK